jgi:hypothetical protein
VIISDKQSMASMNDSLSVKDTAAGARDVLAHDGWLAALPAGALIPPKLWITMQE